MATIVEITVPAEGFPLGTMFRTLRDVTVELERFVPTTGALIPYCWLRGGSIEETSATLRDHPSTASVTVVDQIESQFLVRIEWDPDTDGLVKMLSTIDLVVLSATGNATEWTFEIRADDQTALSDHHS